MGTTLYLDGGGNAILGERQECEFYPRDVYPLSISPSLSNGFACLAGGMPYSELFLLWGILRLNNLDFIVPVFFENYHPEESLSIGLAWAFMAAICIVVGYVFVGMVLLIEKEMKKRAIFKEEDADKSTNMSALDVA